MNKKKKEKLHAFAHVRQTWSINPRTRVKESKKVYSRKHKHKGGMFEQGTDLLYRFMQVKAFYNVTR